MKRLKSVIIKNSWTAILIALITFFLSTNIARAETEVFGVKHLGPSSGWTQSGKDYYVFPAKSNDNILYIASGSGIYKSADNGLSAVKIKIASLGYYTDAIAVSPSDPNRIIVSDNSKTYVSYDGGITWVSVSNTPFLDIKFSPSNPAVVYASSSSYIYKSTDGGLTWKQVSSGYWYGKLAVSPANSDIIYLYNGNWSNSGLNKSIDGGVTWSKIGTGLSASGKIVINPDNSSEIAVIDPGYTTGIYVSENGGDTFSLKGLNTIYLRDIIIVNNSIYAAANNGLYKSTNGGDSWSIVTSGDLNTVYYNGQSKFWFGADDGYYISNDNANSFTKYHVRTSVSSLELDGSANIYALTHDSSVTYDDIWKLSSNAWTKIVDPGYYSADILRILSEKLFYYSDGDVVRCDLAGSNCTTMAFYNFNSYRLPDASNPDLIYVAGRKTYGESLGIYKTANAGQNWQYIAGPVSGSQDYILDVDSTGQKIFAAYDSSKLYYSLNGGTSWTQTVVQNTGFNDIKIINNNVFAATDNGIYYSSDWGNSFSLIFSKATYDIKVDPQNNNHLLIRTSDGMYKSTDAGNTFARLTYFINDVYTINDIEKFGTLWYAATDSGVISFPDNDAPSKPQLVSPSNGASGQQTSNILLDWNAAIDPDNDPIKYTVYMAKVGDPALIPVNGCVNLVATECTVSGLTSTSSYYWKIIAADLKGGSAESEQYSFATVAPKISVSPASLSFSAAIDITSQAQTITISNTGPANLIISAIGISGSNSSQFAQTNNCATVSTGSTCSVSVTFTPSYSGTKSATLTISSNDPDSKSVTVSLSGTATSNSTASYVLTVTKSGSGDISASTGSLSWSGNTGTANYNSTTQVTLTATAGPGYTFTGWGGACSGTGTCSVSMNTNKTVTATFISSSTTGGTTDGTTGGTTTDGDNATTQYTLTVTKSGNGTVSDSTGAIDCGIDCEISLDESTVVTLTADPDEGATFVGWSGACKGSETTCELTMVSDKVVSAVFSSGSGGKTYTITASAGKGGSIDQKGKVKVPQGANITFDISPVAGNEIADVKVDGKSAKTKLEGNYYTFENVTGNHSIMATFRPKTIAVTVTSGTGGKISPSITSLAYGKTQVFTVTPSKGYAIESVTIGGAAQDLTGKSVSKPIKFTVKPDTSTSSLTISATFRNINASDYLAGKIQAGNYNYSVKYCTEGACVTPESDSSGKYYTLSDLYSLVDNMVSKYGEQSCSLTASNFKTTTKGFVCSRSWKCGMGSYMGTGIYLHQNAVYTFTKTQ